jgi:hypothetical protein
VLKILKRRRAAPKVFRVLVPSPHASEDVAQEASNKIPLAHIPVANTLCSYEIHGRKLLRNVPCRLLHSLLGLRDMRMFLIDSTSVATVRLKGFEMNREAPKAGSPIQFVIPPHMRTKVSKALLDARL